MDENDLAPVFQPETNTLLKIGDARIADVVAALIGMADERQSSIIYVGVKESYLQIREAAMEQGVSADHARFVDCVIDTLPDSDIPKEKGVVYANRDESLPNIATSIATLVQDVREEQVVVVIDSLAACLDNHTADEVSSFLETLQEQSQTKDNSIVLFDEGDIVEEQIGAELFDAIDQTLFIEDTDYE